MSRRTTNNNLPRAERAKRLAQIHALRAQGLGLFTLAQRLRIHHTTIRYYLARYGDPLGPDDPRVGRRSNKGWRKTYPPELVARVLKLRGDGLAYYVIGEQLQIDKMTVRQIVKRSGADPKPKGAV